MVDADAIRQRWEAVGAKLDERGRRLFAAAEARTAGRGGLAMVSKITGLARSTINRGEDDLDTQPLLEGRVRRAGGGRRALCDTDPGLVPALKRLVQPATLGDPMRPLIWVSKSLEKLAAALTEMGHPIGPDTVRKELVKLGFSRQSNRKADEGSHHPDRNAQFEYINAKVVAAQVRQQPVISVDTKKKELIGNFKNGGTDYRPKRKPRRVNVHDFEDKKRGKVVPYGVYDMFANVGFVSLGITSDTAEFAVQLYCGPVLRHPAELFQPSTSVAEYGWVAGPVKAGLRPPPSAADGLDRTCHPTIVCHQEFDGKERLKCTQVLMLRRPTLGRCVRIKAALIGSHLDWGTIAVPSDEPSFVVASGEFEECGSQLFDGVEGPHP